MDRILAIVALRFRLSMRKMRGIGGKLNAAGWILWALLGLTVALVSAIGVGILSHFMAAKGPEAAHVCFLVILWASVIFGGVVPVLRGAIDQGFDATPFKQYPISRLRLYAITLGATGLSADLLITYPTLASMTLMGVLIPGSPALPGLLLVALFAMSLAIWSNLFSLVAVSLMRGRRAREALMIAGLGALLVFGILPAALDGGTGLKFERSRAPAAVDDGAGFDVESPRRPAFGGSASMLLTTARLFPPTIAAEGLAALPGEVPARIWTPILQLVGWCAAGLLAGYWVFARFHLAEPRVRVAQRKADARRAAGWQRLGFDRGPLSKLPEGVKAVASKDLRYLFRSVTGRFLLAVGPGVVLLVAVSVGREMDRSFYGIEPSRLLFFGIMLYAGLLTSNFSGNVFAWDADGVKSYFLAPLSPRHLLLGKCIAIWIYDALLASLVILLWCVLLAVPDPITLSTGLLIFASLRLAQSAMGVNFSVRYPLARDISSAKNAPAPLVIWAQMGVVMLTTSLISVLLVLPSLLGLEWLQPVVLAGLAVALGALYAVGLERAARLLVVRRDSLIDALKSVR